MTFCPPSGEPNKYKLCGSSCQVRFRLFLRKILARDQIDPDVGNEPLCTIRTTACQVQNRRRKLFPCDDFVEFFLS
jgi:hypothetical protein